HDPGVAERLAILAGKTMTDDAFLQAILDAPDDDAPRLAYAAHLEQRGEPERAALIRVQCELAHFPEGDERRAALAAQERQLLDEHGEEWLGPLRDAMEIE